ncbi:hypothetical protein ACJMK2_026381 [Sinanodonta woodiana]|uniref:Uncharacterized protein n=1 Tax=Sinanodonta woodiana TaxID=1069815 RepID=A0ABD3XLQ0_SINWO
MPSLTVYDLTDPETETVIPVVCQPNSNIPTISQIQPAVVTVPMQMIHIKICEDKDNRSYWVVANGKIYYTVKIGNGIHESSDDIPRLQELGVTEQLND